MSVCITVDITKASTHKYIQLWRSGISDQKSWNFKNYLKKKTDSSGDP